MQPPLARTIIGQSRSVLWVGAVCMSAALAGLCGAQETLQGRRTPGPMPEYRAAAIQVLHDFRVARRGVNDFGFTVEQSTGATAAEMARYFRGATEIRYWAMRFPDVRSRDGWLAVYVSGCNGVVVARAVDLQGRTTKYRLWTRYLSTTPPVRTVLVWRKMPERAPHRDKASGQADPAMELVVCGTTVFSVAGYQHQEMARRNPKAWEERLSKPELRKRCMLLQQVFTQLSLKAVRLRKPTR